MDSSHHADDQSVDLDCIHGACESFRKAFETGERPQIESYLEGKKDPFLSQLLRALLLLECDLRVRARERIDVEALIQRFPQHQSVVEQAITEFDAQLDTCTYDLVAQCGGVSADSGLDEELPSSDRYRVRSKLGEGAFGSVFLARDTKLDRLVAMKVPKKTLQLNADQFLGEARAAAKVSHPNVVAVHDSSRLADGRPFVVMQYVQGDTLADRLDTFRGACSDTVEIVRQVADALHHAHRQGLIHRDLKPSNILIDKGGKPFVSDFGLALHENEQHAHRGDKSGTPFYRSPEQVRGEANWIDGRSDIWALGVILYQMVVGRRPFQGGTVEELDEEILHRNPRPPRQIDDSIPEWLEAICLKCLSKSPEDRFATADALANALVRGESQSSVTAVQIGRDAIGNTTVSAHGHVVILQAQGVLNSTPESDAPHNQSPYKGLAAFDEQDADVFFGRERQVERIWKLLRDLRTQTKVNRSTVRVVPILGPSGSGKSSIARAGLISELARNPLPGTKDCRVVMLTPGLRPIESLAAVLARTVANDPAPLEKARQFEEELSRQSPSGEYDGLRRIVNLLPDHASSPVILLVDQFEELYSICDSPKDRSTFIQLLLHAAQDPTGHLSVIMTLRSDFISETHDHQELNGIIAERGVLIPAMNDSELRQAIERPAEKCGLFFEEGFVDRLIADTRDREGALPLLQFALTRIWQGVQAKKKPAETLREIGGIGGALAGEAQRVFESLPADDQRIARRAFLAMVQLGEATRYTRRRAMVSSIATSGDNPKHVREVISHFASPDIRLVTLHASDDGAYSAEVTHEALIDHWPQLREWLEDGRDALRFERRLDAAAQEWEEAGRPEGLLWRTPNLELLREFAGGAELTQLQTQFFQGSDELELREKRGERQRRNTYKVGSALIGVLAIAACFFGWRAKQEATVAHTNELRAKENEKIAKRNEEQSEANALLANEQGNAAVETIETLARDLPRILEMLPSEFAVDARKDLLNTAILGLRRIEPDTERATYVAAAAHRGLGDIYRSAGKGSRAIEQYEKSLELAEQSREQYADQPWILLVNRARVEDLIGETHLANHALEAATEHFTKALHHRPEALQKGEETARIKYEIGGSSGNLGRVLLRDESKHAKALDYFEKAVQRRGQFSDANPEASLVKREYAGALWYRGMAKRGLGRYSEAADDMGKAIAMLEDVLVQWEKEPGLQGEYTLAINVAKSFADLGQTFLLWKEASTARPHYEKAEEKLKQLHAKYRYDQDIIGSYWKVLYSLGTLWLPDDEERAATYFQDACELAKRGGLGDIPQMLTYARCHDRQKATALAEKIATEHADRGSFLYQAACGYSLSAWSASSQADSSDDEQLATEAQRFRDKAIELLSQAVDKGYSSKTELADNPELDAIRNEPEFQQLLKRLSDSP